MRRYVGIWAGSRRIVHRTRARALPFGRFVMFSSAARWRTDRFINRDVS